MAQLRTRPIPSVKDTRPDTLHAAIKARQPIKVNGLIDGWTAAGWTFDSLRALGGDTPVTVLDELPKSGGLLPGGQESYEREMPFADFLDHAERPDLKAACYLGYCRPDQLIPGYGSAFDFTPLTPPSTHATDTRLWVGSGGTCSGLHSDANDNVFTQIRGHKRVVLVSVRQTHLVHPFVDNIVNSPVDPEHYDPRQFPRLARARVYTTTVGPGDLLYIPRGWWHYLRSESPSISINHWFGPMMSASAFLGILLRLGPRYVARTAADMVRYGVLGKRYQKNFFFTPPSTGECLYNLIRYGRFEPEDYHKSGPEKRAAVGEE
ncbi:cupin-like domain-containing protein [Nonomuraea sp. NPDC055795]